MTTTSGPGWIRAGSSRPHDVGRYGCRRAVAAAAVLLVPFIPISTADATSAAETCRGLPATMVTTAPRVTGTDGNDVIVAHGAHTVLGLAGDDVICTVETAPSADPENWPHGPLDVVGGPGDDVVDRSGDLAPTAGAEVFEAERVFGSPAPDLVVLPQGVLAAVETGGGDDNVQMVAYTGRGVVDLGAGDDGLSATYSNTLSPPPLGSGRLDSHLTVRGGDGDDDLYVEPGDDRRWLLDLPRGRLSSDRGTRLEFAGLEHYHVPDDTSSGQRMDVRGTSGADDVEIGGRALGKVRLSGGADTTTVFDPPRRGSLVDGGRGRDLLVTRIINTRAKVVIDLAAGRYGRSAGATARIAGVEDVTAAAAAELDVRGDGKSNVLAWVACGGGVVRGGPGNDEIRFPEKVDGRLASLMCERAVRVSAHGGAGDDVLVGGPHADLLAGDRGGDRANGRGGPDRCPAVERRVSC